jgi:hypothetical protein
MCTCVYRSECSYVYEYILYLKKNITTSGERSRLVGRVTDGTNLLKSQRGVENRKRGRLPV